MLSMHELSLSLPEPMLSLSMTILAKSSDLDKMIRLNSGAYRLTLCYSLQGSEWDVEQTRDLLVLIIKPNLAFR